MPVNKTTFRKRDKENKVLSKLLFLDFPRKNW